MSKPRVYDEQPTFSGGLNTNGQRVAVDPSQFADVTNMRVLANGEIAKRPGFRSIRDHGTRITGAFTFYDVSAGRQTILWCDTSSKVYSGAWTASTGALSSSLVTTLSGSATLEYTDVAANFRDSGGTDQLYLPVGGSNKAIKYAAGSLSSLGASTPDNMHCLWVYNSRLFGCTGSNNTLYWSDLNDGDTLGDTASGGGSAIVRTFGSAVAIKGGFALGGTNFILHGGAISMFNGMGFDDISIASGTSGFSAEVGALNTGSWLVVGQMAYLVTNRGLYLVTAGDLVAYDTPERPDPLRTIVENYQTARVYPVLNQRTQEIWFCAHYAVSGGTVTSTAYIFSIPRQRFVGSASLEGITTTGVPVFGLAAGNIDDGKLRSQMFLIGNDEFYGCDFLTASLEVYQDDSANYTSSVRCRRFFCGSQAATKSFRRAVVTMGAGPAGSASADSVTGAEMSTTTPVGGTVASTTDLHAGVPNNIPITGQGAYVDLTITDGGDTSTGWSVASVAVEAFDMGLRGR